MESNKMNDIRKDGDEDEEYICPSCYKQNRAWSFGIKCAFCGAIGEPTEKVVGKDWKQKLYYIDVFLAGRPRAEPTPTTPADHIPYSPEELESVIAYEMPIQLKKGRCDWCGGPWKARDEGPRMCNRCWLNRKQIADKVEKLTPKTPMCWDERLEVARRCI